MEAATNNEDMQNVFDLMDYYNENTIFKQIMRYKEKERLDQINREEAARELGKAEGIIEGKNEGIQEGSEQKTREVLSNMVKLKMPMSQMVLITGLSSAKINQYIADYKIDWTLNYDIINAYLLGRDFYLLMLDKTKTFSKILPKWYNKIW